MALFKSPEDSMCLVFLLLRNVMPKSSPDDSNEDRPYSPTGPRRPKSRAREVSRICLALRDPTGGDSLAKKHLQSERLPEVLGPDVLKPWWSELFLSNTRSRDCGFIVYLVVRSTKKGTCFRWGCKSALRRAWTLCLNARVYCDYEFSSPAVHYQLMDGFLREKICANKPFAR
jgi:hypothetical protein